MTNNSFCVLPWIHLYVGPDGDVLPCCQADHKQVFGRIHEQPVSQIKSNSKFTQLKKDMLANVQNSACSRCYMQESMGLNSERLIQNRAWPDVHDQILSSQTLEADLVYFDIRLSNVCNLRCHMCSSYFSSSIAQEDREIWGTPVPDQRLLHRQRTAAVNSILSHVAGARKMYFAGGEPILSGEHWSILEALVNAGNTNVELIYNTNFTTLEYKNRSVFELWQHFPRIQLMASLDADYEVAEYSRHGTDWYQIKQNLRRLQDQAPHIDFHIASTVSLMTVRNLMLMQRKWYTNGFDLKKWHVSALVSPDHLSTRLIPDIADEITRHAEWCEVHSEDLAAQWRSIAEYSLGKPEENAHAELKRLIAIKDRHRGTNFAEIFPELQFLLD